MSIQSSEEKYEKHIENLVTEMETLTCKIDQLQLSEDRFFTIFNEMEDVYFECDLKGNLTFF